MINKTESPVSKAGAINQDNSRHSQFRRRLIEKQRVPRFCYIVGNVSNSKPKGEGRVVGLETKLFPLYGSPRTNHPAIVDVMDDIKEPSSSSALCQSKERKDSGVERGRLALSSRVGAPLTFTYGS